MLRTDHVLDVFEGYACHWAVIGCYCDSVAFASKSKPNQPSGREKRLSIFLVVCPSVRLLDRTGLSFWLSVRVSLRPHRTGSSCAHQSVSITCCSYHPQKQANSPIFNLARISCRKERNPPAGEGQARSKDVGTGNKKKQRSNAIGQVHMPLMKL